MATYWIICWEFVKRTLDLKQRSWTPLMEGMNSFPREIHVNTHVQLYLHLVYAPQVKNHGYGANMSKEGIWGEFLSLLHGKSKYRKDYLSPL